MNAMSVVGAVVGVLVLLLFLLHRFTQSTAARRNQRLALRGRMTTEDFLAHCSPSDGVSPEVADWLRGAVARHADIPDPETVYPSDRFHRDLHPMGFDDVGTVELIMAVEEHFGIDVPDRDCERIDTVGDLAAYVARRVG